MPAGEPILDPLLALQQPVHRRIELAKLGYSRDQKRGSLQIIYGLLCDKPGRPVAVEVFSGELHDDKTLPSQIGKLKAVKSRAGCWRPV